MIKIVVAYFATLLVFGLLDAVWLSQTANLLYRPILGSIMAPEPRWVPAVIFYALYLAGLLYFAVLPALGGAGLQAALVKGALFGFFAYATYDLTNQATLTVWSTKITIADMVWGSFVSGAAASGGFAITRLFFKG